MLYKINSPLGNTYLAVSYKMLVLYSAMCRMSAQYKQTAIVWIVANGSTLLVRWSRNRPNLVERYVPDNCIVIADAHLIHILVEAIIIFTFAASNRHGRLRSN